MLCRHFIGAAPAARMSAKLEKRISLGPMGPVVEELNVFNMPFVSRCVGCAIGKVTIEQVTKELWPFYGAMCFALLLVTYIPAISLWLPGVMK